jgi:hypothetical protein
MTVHRPLLLASCALALVLLAAARPAAAQDQGEAMRKHCNRDYKRFCAKVPPEGYPAFECLQQHVARLSGACKKAVQQMSGEQ